MATKKITVEDFVVDEASTHYAELIDAEWRKATDGIIKVAKICAEANRKLKPDEKKRLFGKLPFEQSVFSKLAKIGEDRRLQKPSVVKLLPPSYSTIYELTHLTDAKFSKAVDSKKINPNLTRSAAARLGINRSKSDQKSSSETESSDAFYVEIRLSKNAGREVIQAVETIVIL